MFIEVRTLQRVGFILISTIIVLISVIVGHDCGGKCNHIENEKSEVVAGAVEQQPVVNITYIIVEAPKEDVESEKVEPTKTYNVPLTAELQNHIIEQCEDRGIDPALVLAMIRQESNFNVDAMGDDGNAYGLMQIWPKWHSHRMEQYGYDDLRDPFQNVTVGIDIIADYIDKGYGVEWALMAYNGGGAYADKKLAAGEVSEYAQRVVAYADSIKSGGA